MDAMLLPLRRYADFHGRSGRREYWTFLLASFVGLIVLSTLLGMLGAGIDDRDDSPSIVGKVFQLVVTFFWLVLFLPQLAVTVRRLHDQGRTGWFVLLAMVPLIGSFLLLILLALPGEAGSNVYGDPYQGAGHDV